MQNLACEYHGGFCQQNYCKLNAKCKSIPPYRTASVQNLEHMILKCWKTL